MYGKWRELAEKSSECRGCQHGEAQFDFGEAEVVLQGVLTKVAFCVMSLHYSEAFLIQVFLREFMETFQAGHQRAFEFFGGVPRQISYDNSRIAVARFVGKRGARRRGSFRDCRVIISLSVTSAWCGGAGG